MESPKSNPPFGTTRFRLTKPTPNRLSLVPCESDSTCFQSPSDWFSHRFPSEAEAFGAPLLEETCLKLDQSPHVRSVALNEDFFAAILGGDRELGHHVVFYLPEQQFYFFDHRHDCFLATSEEKLKVLLSQYLIRCGQDMGANVNLKSLFELRADKVLGPVIKRARSLLAADDSFFGLESGHARIKGPEFHGKLARMFAREVLEPSPSEVITITECYDSFALFCEARGMVPIKRNLFTSLMADVVREEYQLNVRKDIVGKNQRQQRGWKGLSTRREAAVVAV